MLDLLFVTALYYAQHPLEVALAWVGLTGILLRRFPLKVKFEFTV